MDIQQNIFRKQEKGWVAMRTDIRKYLVNTSKTNAKIIDYLMDFDAFDLSKAKTRTDIAEGLGLHPNHTGLALSNMTDNGWLLSYKKGKVNYFYINKERATSMSPTASPEKVFTKVEPVEVKTTTTKPKKEIQETFDLFNQELAKVFGEAKKLKALNDKRKKDIKKILELEMDNQKLFAGFFKHRKDTDNEYLDFQYILRNPELYLNYALTGDKKTPHETEEQRRARLKYEKMTQDSERILAERRAWYSEPEETSEFSALVKEID